jgi:hypothetical protein
VSKPIAEAPSKMAVPSKKTVGKPSTLPPKIKKFQVSAVNISNIHILMCSNILA